jgi:uncharacterized protein (TIGR00290 family)
MRPRAIVSWSGGKDSALALYEAARDFEIAALLTTITEDYDRISMHGVRRSLLEQQADALGCELETIAIPARCVNADYEARMRAALTKWLGQGVRHVICGDIFLEDIRRYREENLFRIGLQGVFPLWKIDSLELARRFMKLGFRAILCCVDTHALDGAMAGRFYDERLLQELPPGVDPCGENGEFHTFVFDGPNFSHPVGVIAGERVVRDERFCFCDLLPAAAAAGSAGSRAAILPLE